MAFRLTGNDDDAQDLVQEVLLRVRKGLETYRPGSLEGWLSRITTNTFLDEVRRRRRRPVDLLPDDPDRVAARRRRRPTRPSPPRPCPTTCSPPSAGCPPDYRAAVVLCDVVGLPYQEIARRPRRARRHRPQPHPPGPGHAPGGPGVSDVEPHPGRRTHPGDALSALLDGELSPDEEAEVQAHLVACVACRRELEAVRRGPAAGSGPCRRSSRPFGLYERMLQPYRPAPPPGGHGLPGGGRGRGRRARERGAPPASSR